MKKVTTKSFLIAALMLVFSLNAGSKTLVNKIYTSRNHTFHIVDGILWAWGNNENGELGDGTTCSRSTPVRIGTDSTWITLSTTSEKTFGIKADGTLWGWGKNFREGSEYNKPVSLLGLGNKTEMELKPVQIGFDRNWKFVSSGGDHTAAVKSDGTLWAWGGNELFGSLIGCGSTKISSVPMQVGKDLNWDMVSAGVWHTIALKTDGTIWTWGGQGTENVWDDQHKPQKSPTQIKTEVKFKDVSTVSDDDFALAIDGSWWTWKGGMPRQTTPGLKWRSVIASGTSAIGINTDNTVWKWAYANESMTNKILTKLEIGSNWNCLVGDYNYFLGIRTDGTLWGWGDNSYGQLGMNNAAFDTVPKRIVNTTDITNDFLDLIGIPDSLRQKYGIKQKENRAVSVLRFNELKAIGEKEGAEIKLYFKNKNYDNLTVVDASTDVSYSYGNAIYLRYNSYRTKIEKIEYHTVGANYLPSLISIMKTGYLEKTESTDKSWQYAWRGTDIFIKAKEFINKNGANQVAVVIDFKQ